MGIKEITASSRFHIRVDQPFSLSEGSRLGTVAVRAVGCETSDSAFLPARLTAK